MRDELLEALTSAWEQAYNPDQILAYMIARKLRDRGITLSEEQIKAIRVKLEQGELHNSILTFEADSIDTAHSARQNRAESLVIEFSQDDTDRVEIALKQAVRESVAVTANDVATALVKEWHQQATTILPAERSSHREFTESIMSVWGNAIDLLDMLLGVTNEMARDYTTKLRDAAASTMQKKAEAIARLHARGCRVVFEIIILLKNGCADGAQARWRTLHELCIVATFLSEHGDETSDRYLQHEAIERYKAAKAHQAHCKALGLEPLPAKEYAEIDSARRILLKRFGKHFGDDWGWAGVAIKKPNAIITFTDLEKHTKFEHLRPIVQLSHPTVHAGARGIAYQLGAPFDATELLDGPSPYGLEEPGKNTAYSLNLLTAALLSLLPTLDATAFLEAVHGIAIEIYEQFNLAASIAWSRSEGGQV